MKHPLQHRSLSKWSYNLATSVVSPQTSSTRLARATLASNMLYSSSSNTLLNPRSYHASTHTKSFAIRREPRSNANHVASLVKPSANSSPSRSIATHTESKGATMPSINTDTATQALPPFSFLRSFSTSSLTSSLQLPTSLGLLLAKMPRLKSEEGPPNRRSPSRRYPSILFNRSPRGSNSPPPPNGRGPQRQNKLLAYFAHLDARFFSRLPERFVIYAILALNGLVFMSWIYASESLRRFSDPRPYIFLGKNFLSGWPNISEGRWWTLLTSCLSHEALDHFLINMISLSFMAPPVLALTGPTTFVALYFGAGVVSSIVSLVARKLVQNDKTPTKPAKPYSHGASGSVYAIMSTFACVHPTATFLVFFVIPAPAWACVTGIFAWDLWHAANKPGGATDSAGHLGGIVAGILFWRFGLRSVRVN